MMDPAVTRAVEVFAGINLIVVGVSHALQPKAWSAFFALLHSKGAPGSFLNGFLSLGMGSIIVAFHSVWSGPPMVLTIYGCALVAKGAFALAFPAQGLRSMERGIEMPQRKWVIAGVLLILLGAAVLAFGTEVA